MDDNVNNSDYTTKQSTGRSVNKNINSLPFFLVFAVLLVGSAGAWWFWSGGKEGTSLDINPQSTISNEASYPEVVATVNGKEISRDNFLQSLEQTRQLATLQGADANDLGVLTMIEGQALEVLINTELLAQASAGIEVSGEEVDVQIANFVNEYGDEAAFLAELEKFDLTVEALREDIAEQLRVDAYVKQSAEYNEISVNPDEVQTFYDELAGQGQALPPFEEVSAQIQESLLVQKQQEAIAKLIERLSSGADIERNL